MTAELLYMCICNLYKTFYYISKDVRLQKIFESVPTFLASVFPSIFRRFLSFLTRFAQGSVERLEGNQAKRVNWEFQHQVSRDRFSHGTR